MYRTIRHTTGNRSLLLSSSEVLTLAMIQSQRAVSVGLCLRLLCHMFVSENSAAAVYVLLESAQDQPDFFVHHVIILQYMKFCSLKR